MGEKVKYPQTLPVCGLPGYPLVSEAGLEPARFPTRPSNVRVCLFRHSDVLTLIVRIGPPVVNGARGPKISLDARRPSGYTVYNILNTNL